MVNGPVFVYFVFPVTPWTAARQASLSFTVSRSLLRLTSIESVGDAIQPSHSLSSPLLLASIFPSIGVFSHEPALRIRWPKYWSFSFSVSPFNEYSGLISFRIDWSDLFAVQGTLKCLQHRLQKHQFFSLLYGPTVTSIHDYWQNHSFPVHCFKTFPELHRSSGDCGYTYLDLL